jgi:multidrug efflux pump subunit AcrA (membrane-fusion protein)
MNQDIFRKVSVERLSSPEQLDTLLKVTSPRSWLALIALGLLLSAAIIWGFFGTLDTKIGVEGVLIRPGGLQTVYASSGGIISDIRVVENDYVRKGNVVARVEQPQILRQIAGLKVSSNADNPVAQAVADLQAQYYNQANIVSAYTGRVLDVNVKKGSSVGSGTALFTVESGEARAKDLQAVMYVPAQVGKKIVPGMPVSVSPSSVNKEEYGFILGRVTSVSDFPLTAQSMFLTLGNESLVKELSRADAALLEVIVDLTPDAATVSGYRWSTPAGPPQPLDSGTLVSASITVKQQKPISSIIPQIK